MLEIYVYDPGNTYKNYYNDMINLLMGNPNSIIVVILVLSITVVFISIIYVLLQAPQNPKLQSKSKKIGKKSIGTSQEKKGKNNNIKYTKEFLRRVKGLDLELKEKSG
jgi:Na+-transporting NADH:ubiquinone oxidoreductase subunit NqrC